MSLSPASTRCLLLSPVRRDRGASAWADILDTQSTDLGPTQEEDVRESISVFADLMFQEDADTLEEYVCVGSEPSATAATAAPAASEADVSAGVDASNEPCAFTGVGGEPIVPAAGDVSNEPAASARVKRGLDEAITNEVAQAPKRRRLVGKQRNPFPGCVVRSEPVASADLASSEANASADVTGSEPNAIAVVAGSEPTGSAEVAGSEPIASAGSAGNEPDAFAPTHGPALPNQEQWDRVNELLDKRSADLERQDIPLYSSIYARLLGLYARNIGLPHRKARPSFKKMTRKERRALVREYLKHNTIPQRLELDYARYYAKMLLPSPDDDDDDGSQDSEVEDPDGEKHRFLSTKAVLLTWNGDWGIIPDKIPLDFSMERLVDFCKRHPKAVRAWTEAKEFMVRLRDQYRLSRWTLSIEICPRTWRDLKNIRLHLHMFLEVGSNRRLRVRSANRLSFLTTFPMKGMDFCPARGQSSAKHAAAGHYYLAMPKIGKVFWEGSHQPFTDYAVNHLWIQQAWQMGKLTDEKAEDELIDAKKDVVRMVQNVHDQARMVKLRRQRANHLATQNRLLQRRRACVEIPEVTAWLKEQEEEKERQKFLVLDGPSQTGKTVFAMSLLGPEVSLEVDCAATEYPDLRMYDEDRHKVVFFDEASTSLVLKHKKLFQCPASLVTLGSSATNCHSYQVWFHGVRVVIASNKWSEELEQCSPADREWLTRNSVYVRVTGPLWETTEPLASGDGSEPAASPSASSCAAPSPVPASEQ